MFGLSFAEIAVIILVIVLIFGPDKLPEVARLVAKGYREMKKLSNTVRDAVSFEDSFEKQNYKYVIEEPKELNFADNSALDELKPQLHLVKNEDPEVFEVVLTNGNQPNFRTERVENSTIHVTEIPLEARKEHEIHREIPL